MGSPGVRACSDLPIGQATRHNAPKRCKNWRDLGGKDNKKSTGKGGGIREKEGKAPKVGRRIPICSCQWGQTSHNRMNKITKCFITQERATGLRVGTSTIRQREESEAYERRLKICSSSGSISDKSQGKEELEKVETTFEWHGFISRDHRQ